MERYYPTLLGDDLFFQNYICLALEKLGLTDYELACLIDTSVPAIRCWKTGRGFPAMVIRKIAYDMISREARKLECVN